MAQPAKAQEPSMEEILASIRRIIADDDAAKPPAKGPAKPTEAPAAPPPAAAASAAAAGDEMDAMLEDLDEELNAQGISLVFAELKDPVRRKIERYGLTRTIDPAHFFPTIGAAVKAFRQETGAQWPAVPDQPGDIPVPPAAGP